MKFLSSRFIQLKNQYLIPLINIDFRKEDSENYELKNLLLNAKFQSVQSISNDTYEFDFDKDLILKSILADFELFYSKGFIQQSNIQNLDKSMSICWKIVTDYYRYFFQAVALTRLLRKGNGFLDEDSAKKLSGIVTSLLTNVFKIERGNYKYNIKIHPTNPLLLKVEIKFNTKSSHESVWILINESLKDMIRYSNIKDEEELILKTLVQINKDYSNNFMSNIRNEVNYKGKYATISLENRIPYYFLDQITDFEYIRKISKYSHSPEESYKYYCFSLYGKYLQFLVEGLYEDYSSRLELTKLNTRTFSKLRSDYSKKIKK